VKHIMPEPPIPRSIDRRKFMNGGWTDRDDERSSDTVEIASILVRARPEHLDEAARAIETLPGAQIYSRDPKGKLVVVIEATDTGSVGATLNVISSLPHVLTASLVFHGTDTG
jgi:periplasmic nitrate reductase NapD